LASREAVPAAFRGVLWLAKHADGRLERFETECTAPDEVGDELALKRLVSEVRRDFERDFTSSLFGGSL